MTEESRKEIKEAVNTLTKLCILHQVPLFLVFAEEKDEGTVYEHSVITPKEAGVVLTDDRITKYSASLNKNLVLTYKNADFTRQASGDVMDMLIGDEE